MSGNKGNDRLEGGDGDDRLNGGSGNGNESPFYNGERIDIGRDYLDGGTGNDLLHGGAGADIYVWGRGYGNDEITEKNFHTEVYQVASNYTIVSLDQVKAENTSTLNLINLNPRDIEFIPGGTTKSQQFTLRIKNTGETLLWRGEFGLTDINIQFANGAQWTTTDLQAKLLAGTAGDDVRVGFLGVGNMLDGGTGRDTLTGGDRSDTLLGGKGNDDLNGGNGDDIINGGAGFDIIDGGTGADQYLFNKGNGTDVLIGSNYSLFDHL